MIDAQQLQHALQQIAAIASSVAEGPPPHRASTAAGRETPTALDLPVDCTVRSIPRRLVEKAATAARGINPANGPLTTALSAFPEPAPIAMRIAITTTRYWGPQPRTLTVSFMESAPVDLRSHILSHMNAWSTRAGISFAETEGDGEVRISREPGGYWSYLGTDILAVPTNRQTMNLERFTMSTPESEYRRVVRHETGHTLGFPHEHMRSELVARIDRQKAYAYFRATQGWDERTVDEQVLTSLDESSIMATPPDDTSIMCYQLPGTITTDGQPIRGGTDINESDYAFAAGIYPKWPEEAMQRVRRRFKAAEYAPDWGEANDPARAS